MDKQFWIDKWERKEIGFHMLQAHPLLIEQLPRLGIAVGAHLFLPLCGKSLDIHWLLEAGYRVTGVELSEIAVKELFTELHLEPLIEPHDALTSYRAGNLQVFVGDVFNLQPRDLNSVDFIYDRAALIALPKDLRNRYLLHLTNLAATAGRLLITIEYENDEGRGPPFVVGETEIIEHFSSNFDIRLVQQVYVEKGLKGAVDIVEKAWYLKRRV